MMQRQTYTIDEVAALLGISRNSAYLAARNNRLPVAVIRIGKRMMVRKSEFDRLLGGGIAAPLARDAEWDESVLGIEP